MVESFGVESFGGSIEFVTDKVRYLNIYMKTEYTCLALFLDFISNINIIEPVNTRVHGIRVFKVELKILDYNVVDALYGF